MGSDAKLLRQTGAWAAGLVGALAAIALGVMGSAIYLAPESPGVLAPARGASTVPVGRSMFADERSVELEISRQPDVPITAPTGGRITRSDCTVGAEITSGRSFLSIDGQPTLTLATSTPLWRELSAGDRGDDVRALQAELARLGHTVVVDGVMGKATSAALADAFRAIGGARASTSEGRFARIVWIPSPAVRVSACDSVSGASIDAGAPVAHAAGTIAQAALRDLPADLVPGDRVVIVAGRKIPLTAHGDLDSEGLRLLTEIAGQRGLRTGDDNPSISVSVALASPVEVTVVPPSAVYGIVAGKGCVSSGGASVPVTIAGSQLGQTFVTFETEKYPTVVDIAPTKKSSCR